MIALPDANTLQAIGETMLVAGQRAADPPLAVPNDSALSAYNTYPGGLMYYDIEAASAVGGNPFFPLKSGENLPLTRDMQIDMRDQIWNAFFRNILRLPVDGPAMTATEVIERREEFIREIGPVFGRLESDYSGPLIERAFRIMLRNDAFLPIPDALGGQSVRFEYESPVKRIRQAIEAAAARLWVAERAELMAVDPSALDIVDLDAYGRFGADAAGLPTKIVRGADAVAAIRKQRQEAQAAAQQAEMAERMAGAAKTAGEVPGIKEALQNAAGGPSSSSGQPGRAA